MNSVQSRMPVTYDNNAEQVRNVTYVYSHEEYNVTNFSNDIAILVLDEPLEFNEYVQPIKIRESSWILPGLKFYNIRTNPFERANSNQRKINYQNFIDFTQTMPT